MGSYLFCLLNWLYFVRMCSGGDLAPLNLVLMYNYMYFNV